MEKLIIWGEESVIGESIGSVSRFASAGDVRILGISARDRVPEGTAAGNGFPLLDPGAPEWEEADCVLVCTEAYSGEVVREALAAGAAREKLIPCRLMGMEGFSFGRYMRLARSRVSILANCCWGGLTYHYFRLDFLSPTINLFFADEDYLRFLENLDAMLEKEPVFDRMEYSPEEDFHYPVFDLDGVKLHMNHCHDKAQGLREWNERRARVNPKNLLVTMITESPETAKRFDRLPFERKVCFVPFRTELPSCVSVDPGGVPFVSYINSFASGTRRLYDPWILLEAGRAEILAEAPGAAPEAAGAVYGRAETVLVYGAQGMGTRAWNMLKTFPENKLAGFAVSSMEGNPSEKYGYPVKSIGDWRKTYRDRDLSPDRAAVVMALHPDYYDEVRKTLRKNGFPCILTFEELEWLFHHKDKS